MANATIDYERDVLPLEQKGYTDAEIADIINTMTRRDIPLDQYRLYVEADENDVLFLNAQTGTRTRGSMGEASRAEIDYPGDTHDPWTAADNRAFNRLVNGLYSTRTVAPTFSKPEQAKTHYDFLLTMYQYRYTRYVVNNGGTTPTPNTRAIDQAQVDGIIDLGGGWLYGPPTDGNAATAAEVTQSRVDWNNQQEKNTAYTFLQDTETQNALNAANSAVSDPAKSKADVYADFDAQQTTDKANRP